MKYPAGCSNFYSLFGVITTAISNIKKASILLLNISLLLSKLTILFLIQSINKIIPSLHFVRNF